MQDSSPEEMQEALRIVRGQVETLYLRPELMEPFNLFCGWFHQVRRGGMGGQVTGFDFSILYAWASAPGRVVSAEKMNWLEKCFAVFEREVVCYAADKAEEQAKKQGQK